MVPTVRVDAQDAPPAGLGISLTEAPVDRRDDPRALAYIVDHVRPGTALTRSFEVSNGGAEPITVDLYVAPAELQEGAFVPALRGAPGDLSSWSTVTPGSLTVEPGSSAQANLSIEVPDDASSGERYGIVAAEGAPVGGGQVNVAPRVGIRIYLSVGEGGEPESDFVVDSLRAGREEDGTPVVLARVQNTGGRALDMRGELALANGPGGVAAGPFPATLGTTLAIGETAPVEVRLDKDLPNGPWDATLTLRSGTLEHTVTATIDFPDPGEESKVFSATARAKNKSRFAGAATVLLVVVATLLVYLWARHRRQS